MRLLFRQICEAGNIVLANLLFVHYKHIIDTKHAVERAFRKTCTKGHLDVAKWLLKIRPDLNISANHYFAFFESCVNGHLKMAKWIFNILTSKGKYLNKEYKTCLQTAEWIDDTFSLACAYNKMNVAKWMLIKFPNIDVSYNNHFGFSKACQNGNLTMVVWLIDIQSSYKFVKDRQTKKLVPYFEGNILPHRF